MPKKIYFVLRNMNGRKDADKKIFKQECTFNLYMTSDGNSDSGSTHWDISKNYPLSLHNRLATATNPNKMDSSTRDQKFPLKFLLNDYTTNDIRYLLIRTRWQKCNCI